MSSLLPPSSVSRTLCRRRYHSRLRWGDSHAPFSRECCTKDFLIPAPLRFAQLKTCDLRGLVWVGLSANGYLSLIVPACFISNLGMPSWYQFARGAFCALFLGLSN